MRGAAAATTAAEWVAALAYLGVLYQRRDALGGLSPSLVLVSKLSQTLEEMGPFCAPAAPMLMRTRLLLGTKTLASATAARCARTVVQAAAGAWCAGMDAPQRQWLACVPISRLDRTLPIPAPCRRLGVVPVAAHQVVTQLWLLSSLIVDSVAIAGQSLVAVQLGRGDVAEARAGQQPAAGAGHRRGRSAGGRLLARGASHPGHLQQRCGCGWWIICGCGRARLE